MKEFNKMLSIIVGDEYKQNYPTVSTLTGVALITDAFKKNPQIKIISNLHLNEMEYIKLSKISLVDDQLWRDAYVLLDCSNLKPLRFVTYLALQHNIRNLTMYYCYPNLEETPRAIKNCAKSFHICQYQGKNILEYTTFKDKKPPKTILYNATQYLKYYTKNMERK